MTMQQSEKATIVVNSLPKSGTHLVKEALSLFPQIESDGRKLSHKATIWFIWRHLGVPFALYCKLSDPFKKDPVRLNVDTPHYASKKSVIREISKVDPKGFLLAHLPYSDTALNIMLNYNAKMILVIRDPRDVVVSFAHFVVKSENFHPLFDAFRGLTQNQRILAAINGGIFSGIELRSVADAIGSLLQWQNSMDSILIRFEDLIGPKGGGSVDVQEKQIQRIADFLGFELDSETVKYIASKTFSPLAGTFRKGEIGSWREEFSIEHIQAMKDNMGQELLTLGYETTMDWGL
jgi:hypothetical protein